MEYKVAGTVLNFSCTLGTIKAIENVKKKSFMSIAVGSYSSTGTCLATVDDMLDVLSVSYAKAHKTKPQHEAVKEFKEFIENCDLTYNELFTMYDKLLVSLQYQGKTDEEIQEIILGNLRKAEEMKAKIEQKMFEN